MAEFDLSKYAIPEVDATQAATPLDRVKAAGYGYVHGGALGFADEIAGTAGALGARAYDKATGSHLFDNETLGSTVGQGIDTYRANELKAKNAAPGVYLASDLAGTVATGSGLAKVAPSVFGMGAADASLGARVLQAGKAGAVSGAITGAGDTQGGAVDRLGGAAIGGVTGAVVGPVLGEAARGAARGGAALAEKFGFGAAKYLNPTATSAGQTPAEKALAMELAPRQDLLNKIPEAEKAMALAKSQGIQLTTPEAFQDPNLLKLQGVLPSKSSEGAVAAQELANARQKVQLPNALQKQIGDISPVGSPDEAGRGLIEGSQKVEQALRDAMKVKAKPYYDDAFYTADETGAKVPKTIEAPDTSGGLYLPPRNQGGTVVTDSTPRSKVIGRDAATGEKITQELTPSTKTSLVSGQYGPPSPLTGLTKNPTYNYFAREISTDPLTSQLPENSFARLDAIRSRALTAARELERSGDKNSADWRQAQTAAKKINGIINDNLDDAGKDSLLKARSFYTEGSPEIERFIQDKLGKIGDAKVVSEPNVPNQMMSGSLEQTKNVAKYLPKSTVQAGVAGYLQNTAQKIKGDNVSGVTKKIFDTPQDEAKFQTLLGDKYQPFAELMDTFERVHTGQNYLKGSPTQERLETGGKIASMSAGDVADLAHTAVHNPVAFGVKMMGKITSQSASVKNAQESAFYKDFANLLLTDRGIGVAKSLVAIQPTIARAKQILTSVMQTGAAGGAIAGGEMATKIVGKTATAQPQKAGNDNKTKLNFDLNKYATPEAGNQ